MGIGRVLLFLVLEKGGLVWISMMAIWIQVDALGAQSAPSKRGRRRIG